MTETPKSMKKRSKGKSVASSNWLDLKKTLDSKLDPHRKKRQKLDLDKLKDFPLSLSSFHEPVPSMSLSEHVGSDSSLGDTDVNSSTRPVALRPKKLSAKYNPENKRKLDPGKHKDILPSSSSYHEPVPSTSLLPVPKHVESSSILGGDVDENSRTALQSMALALEKRFSDEQRLPGRYLSLDCEMVGVGINASESSLARVSLVNYHGVVIIDEYVKQRERVVDYRTRWSGIRASDMINAKPFEEVQKTVNDLLDGRILIGHAVYNDLKVLLLSHPNRQTRDTQLYAYKFGLSKSHHISLKNLAKQELGIDIQTGEHSSVVDARATMAIYRLHKKDWEGASGTISQTPGPKRKRSTQVPETDTLSATFMTPMLEREGIEEVPPSSDVHRKKRAKTKGDTPSFPGGGRKGVSSGLSTIVRRGEELPKSRHAWWKLLPPGAKKSIRVDR